LPALDLAQGSRRAAGGGQAGADSSRSSSSSSSNGINGNTGKTREIGETSFKKER
jgi:hypothetical protein